MKSRPALSEHSRGGGIWDGGQDAWEDALRAALQALGGPHLRCLQVDVRQFRRVASRRAPQAFECRVAITWRETLTGREATVVYQGGSDWPDAPVRPAGEGESGWIEPPLGPGLLALPWGHAVLWACPNDPALPQLPRLLRPDAIAACLPPAYAGATVAAVQVIAQAPRRHAVLRVQLQEHAAAQGCEPDREPGRLPRPGVEPVCLVAKIYSDDKASQVHARAEAFWQLQQRDPLAPPVARPLGLDPGSRTVWFSHVDGVPLADLLDGPLALPALAAAARTLARVHDVPLPGVGVRDLAFHLAEIERRRRKLVRLWPARAGRIERLAASLATHAPCLPTPQLSVIHGDCQPGQFLLADGVATVLDLDGLATGMPMEDLAEFIVKLRGLDLPRQEVDRRVEAFVRAYVMAAPTRYAASWMHWHVAVQALLAASRLAQSGRTGWEAAALDLLDTAEIGLAELAPLEACIS